MLSYIRLGLSTRQLIKQWNKHGLLNQIDSINNEINSHKRSLRHNHFKFCLNSGDFNSSYCLKDDDNNKKNTFSIISATS